MAPTHRPRRGSRPRLPRRHLLLGMLALVLGLCARPGTGRAVTYLEQAERLQRIYAHLLDLRPAAPPRVEAAGYATWALELIAVPDVDTRVGSKDEPISPPPAIPRARLRFVNGWGGSLGLGWTPPVTVSGFTANLQGLELGWQGRALGLLTALRAYSFQGRVLGGITAAEAEDQFTVATQGVDLRLGAAWGALTGYAGVGQGHANTKLIVESDGATLTTEDDFATTFAGVAWRAGGWHTTLEQNWTDGILRHFSLTVGHDF